MTWYWLKKNPWPDRWNLRPLGWPWPLFSPPRSDSQPRHWVPYHGLQDFSSFLPFALIGVPIKIHSCVKCPKWGIKFPCLFQKSKMSDILMIFWWYDGYWIDVQYLKYSVYIKYTKMAIIIFSNQVINIIVIIVINNNSNNRNNLFLYISKLFFSRCLVSPHFLGQTQIWTSSQFLQLQQGSFTNFREPSSRKTLYSTPGEHQNRWNNSFWPKNMEIFGSNPTPK